MTRFHVSVWIMSNRVIAWGCVSGTKLGSGRLSKLPSSGGAHEPGSLFSNAILPSARFPSGSRHPSIPKKGAVIIRGPRMGGRETLDALYAGKRALMRHRTPVRSISTRGPTPKAPCSVASRYSNRMRYRRLQSSCPHPCSSIRTIVPSQRHPPHRDGSQRDMRKRPFPEPAIRSGRQPGRVSCGGLGLVNGALVMPHPLMSQRYYCRSISFKTISLTASTDTHF